MTDTTVAGTPAPPAKRSLFTFADSPQFGAFVISIVIVAAFVAVLTYAMIYGIKDNQTLSLLTGSLINAFGTVVAYWIGSSSSSRSKDAVIASQAGAKP